VGADLDVREGRGIARQLVAAGMLHPDASALGAMRLTDKARPVLTGEQTVMLRRVATPPLSSPRRSARGRGPDSGPPLTPADQVLFEALRAERARIAEQNSVPAYVVFHDSTLREMATKRPSDAIALRLLPGIGAAKMEKYGDRFLAVIAAAS
jgi:ATP-dependent DNA helicase RecQ